MKTAVLMTLGHMKIEETFRQLTQDIQCPVPVAGMVPSESLNQQRLVSGV